MLQVSSKILYKILYFLCLFFGFSWASAAKAVCPVCVVAVGAGLGLSRWLRVDDVISSIWIGGLLWGLSAWTIVWFRKKNWGFKYDSLIIVLAYYLLILGPLYYSDIMGHPMNKIFGIDKILFGTALGTMVFFGSARLNEFLKIKNNGKSYFPYQKVVLPVAALILASLFFYYLLY